MSDNICAGRRVSVVERVEFDPWDIPKSTVAVDKNEPRPIESFAPESLIKRARRRHVETIQGGWEVEGDPKLGDAFDGYLVRFNAATKKYDCDCYTTDHGAVRRRKMCSHVLAVIMHRRAERETGSVRGGEVVSRGALVPESEVRVLPPEPDPEPEPEPELHVELPTARDDIPTPDDPMWGNPGLPAWVSELRPHQWDAVQEAVEHFAEGKRVVFLDAPTGSGKTLIGELVRRLVSKRALYVCSSKGLQDQFLKDFDYARVLKGRSNYPTQLAEFPEITCADCTKDPGPLDEATCEWCDEPVMCEYERAKMSALRSPIAVVNTTYLLNEANYVGNFSGRGLVVLDECDVLESELMGFVEFEMKASQLNKLGVTPPKKGSHYRTIAKWLTDELEPAVKAALKQVRDGKRVDMWGKADVRTVRRENQLRRLLQAVERIGRQMSSEGWVRDNEGPMTLKPVRVNDYGEQMLWRHGDRWLAMSATIISPDEMADSLGLEGQWGVVRVPMTFPVENRTIHVAGVASMTAKEKDTSYPKMLTAIRKVLDRHPGERVLIHTVSYDLARYIASGLRGSGRPIVTYGGANQRTAAMSEYLSRGDSVMVAPSMDRGVDLPGDMCRVQIVAKVPFPYLGDKQVSTRMHGPGGKTWYAVQTVRTLVQMTGRGVRSKDDYCTTYVLDKQFQSNIWKRNKGLFPAWWREAVDTSFPTRELRG